MEKKHYATILEKQNAIYYFEQGHSKRSCKRMVKAKSTKTVSDWVKNRENIMKIIPF